MAIEIEIEFVGVDLDDEKVSQLMQTLTGMRPIVVAKAPQTPTEKVGGWEKCRECDVALGDDNWNPSQQPNDRICKTCHNSKATARKQLKEQADKKTELKKKPPASTEEMREVLAFNNGEATALADEGITTLSEFLDAEADVLMEILKHTRNQISALKRMARVAIKGKERKAVAEGKKPKEPVKKKRWQHSRFTDEHWFSAMWVRIRRVALDDTKVMLSTDNVVRLFRDDMVVDYELNNKQLELINTVGRDIADIALRTVYEMLGPTMSAQTGDVGNTTLMLFRAQSLPAKEAVWDKIRG